jgi:hypothetical protein
MQASKPILREAGSRGDAANDINDGLEKKRTMRMYS